MKFTKSIMEHPEWGTIIVARNARARRIILRSHPDGIHLTVPTFATQSDIERAINECVPKLLQKQPQVEPATIDTNYNYENENFAFKVAEHKRNIFQLQHSGKYFTLLCPVGTDYYTTEMQKWMHRTLTQAITCRAKEILPQRLRQLAKEKGFAYNRCTVRKAHTRWGSCNTKGNISLNASLLQLPDELIDYVLLHELCHTVEMNHSERFWALMDKVTAPSKAKELRKKLKTYRTNF